MNTDAIKQRLVEEVKLRGFDDQYIDREEEKEILKEAIAQGLTLDVARSLLQQVCEHSDYVIESTLDLKAKEILDQFANNDGYVDKKEFDDTVAILYKASKGRLSEPLCRKKAKELILSNGWRVKEGFLKGGHWFSEI
jgi:proline dehydrogenase